MKKQKIEKSKYLKDSKEDCIKILNIWTAIFIPSFIAIIIFGAT